MNIERRPSFGQDEKNLGAQIGFIAILHRWGQNLMDHIHIHCVVPGGGLIGYKKWKHLKKDFLFPIKPLSAMLLSLWRAAAIGCTNWTGGAGKKKWRRYSFNWNRFEVVPALQERTYENNTRNSAGRSASDGADCIGNCSVAGTNTLLCRVVKLWPFYSYAFF